MRGPSTRMSPVNGTLGARVAAHPENTSNPSSATFNANALSRTEHGELRAVFNRVMRCARLCV